MLYIDIESGQILTYEELQSEYEDLKRCKETECENVEEYIFSCLNGSLEKVN